MAGGRDSDDQRLERLWEGDFGTSYTARNAAVHELREPFWREITAKTSMESVLEVGCNAGPNLRWLAEIIDPAQVSGVDVNEDALARVRAELPAVNVLKASATELPFPDRSFDLVFTTGVLIHLAPDVLPQAMAEIVRCSDRFVLCGEYYADELTEVPYRGQKGALFKRDFGELYGELFPELELVERGFLGRSDGWDDVTWWLLRRP